MSVSLRPADPADVPFLVELVNDPGVAPFLAASRSRTTGQISEDVERSRDEADAYGVLVIEAQGAPVGTATWEQVNRRSRIAALSGLAIAPAVRGRGYALAATRLLARLLLDERDFHRVQLEVYGFNEPGLQLAERAGFIREGIRRKAYLYDGEFVDGVLYGLVAEDLDVDPR